MRYLVFGICVLMGTLLQAGALTPTPVACAPASAQKTSTLLMDNLACRAIVMATTKGKCSIYILAGVPILDCEGTRYSFDLTPLP